MFVRLPSRLVAPALCAVLLPAAASAQVEPKGFYVTLYGQYSTLGSSTISETGPNGAGSGLRAEFGDGGGWGGDVGWRYGNGWAAEIEWNYRRYPLDSLTRAGVNLASDGGFGSNTFLLNGLRRFPTGGAWTPYLGAGLGWVQEIEIDIKTIGGGVERSYSKSSEFAFQLIAGAEYAITPNWRLTADARWLRVGSVTLDNEVANSGGKVGPLDYNPFSVQVGVRYAF